MILSEDRATQRNRLELVPGKLWSLWDLMKQFPLDHLAQAIMRGDSLSIARNDPSMLGLSTLGSKNEQEVLWFLDDVEQCCAAAGLGDVAKFARELRERIDTKIPISPMEAFTSVAHIGDMLVQATSKRWFMMMDEAERAAFEHPHYFGEDVWEAFPSARIDASEAGTCFACGRYNAAAYHCVQAAEIGLRVLAKDRRCTVKSHRKKIPLDQAQWGDLLNAIENATLNPPGWSRGPAKDAADQFYKKALQDGNALNDGWRRHLSHARSHEYQRDEVEGLIGHSRRFLQRLAERLGEDRPRLPLIWRSASAGLRRA